MTITFSSDVSLQALNTFGIAARARRYTELTDLVQLPALLAALDGPVLWLGGGSNLLLRGDYDGTVVRIRLRGIRVIAEDGDALTVEAAAGENWHDFVCHCLQQGWNGLENLSLIPGTVGASPIQNIGAYGVEVKDCISSVVCADLQHGGRSVLLDNADCRFAYRDSLFKQQAGRYLVTAVRFRLSRSAQSKTQYGDIARQLLADGVNGEPSAQDVSRAVIAIRRSKLPDPAQLGNAGSFFKNPLVSRAEADALLQRFPALPHYPAGEQVKLAAGWLIDQAGLKGYRDGDAGIHQHQALVLVNYGHASGEQIAALADKIRAEVLARYGVTLEAEPVTP